MAMKVRYTVMNGEVIAQKRGGVRSLYVPDPLGSTMALLDSTLTKTDTFSYWPYGEVASRTGTTATPLQYVGNKGYYRDNASRTYVGARVLDTRAGRWMTQDPIGFNGGDLNLYTYVLNNATNIIDSTGLRPSASKYCPQGSWTLMINSAIGRICNNLSDIARRCQRSYPAIPWCLGHFCNTNATIHCSQSGDCADPSIGAYTERPTCCFGFIKLDPEITFCTNKLWRRPGLSDWDSVWLRMMHELMHYCGMRDHPRYCDEKDYPKYTNPADAAAIACLGLSTPPLKAYTNKLR